MISGKMRMNRHICSWPFESFINVEWRQRSASERLSPVENSVSQMSFASKELPAIFCSGCVGSPPADRASVCFLEIVLTAARWVLWSTSPSTFPSVWSDKANHYPNILNNSRTLHVSANHCENGSPEVLKRKRTMKTVHWTVGLRSTSCCGHMTAFFTTTICGFTQF